MNAEFGQLFARFVLHLPPPSRRPRAHECWARALGLDVAPLGAREGLVLRLLIALAAVDFLSSQLAMRLGLLLLSHAHFDRHGRLPLYRCGRDPRALARSPIRELTLSCLPRTSSSRSRRVGRSLLLHSARIATRRVFDSSLGTLLLLVLLAERMVVGERNPHSLLLALQLALQLARGPARYESSKPNERMI